MPMRRTRRNWLVPATRSLLFLVLLPASACDEFERAREAPEPPPPSVTVASVEEASISPEFTFIGQTRAVDSVDFRARVEGFLIDRPFVEGDDVDADALLFVIEQEPYQAAVEVAEAALAEAEAAHQLTSRDRERTEILYRRGEASEQRRDQAVAEERGADARVQAARAELDRARLNLDYTEVKAPFAGRIGQAAFSVGELVGPGSGPLAHMVRLDPIQVSFQLDEPTFIAYRILQLERQRAGADPPLFVPSLRLPGGIAYPESGRIDFIDNRVDPTTGTITVRTEFANPDRLLVPGQFVTVVVQAEEDRKGLVVPRAAVQRDQTGPYVMVVDDEDTVQRRRIETGERIGIHWEVTDGLREGERVIYQGLQKVRPGMVVDPVESPPAQPAGI
ncbi:MAG: efflux RND transporter periplasmic adaptor subunit [Rhodospirillales bacterium]|nr:MAG: efflux RND transporter periplasmic adaptor subunit [Rhodospirillales bacterium]